MSVFLNDFDNLDFPPLRSTRANHEHEHDPVKPSSVRGLSLCGLPSAVSGPCARTRPRSPKVVRGHPSAVFPSVVFRPWSAVFFSTPHGLSPLVSVFRVRARERSFC